MENKEKLEILVRSTLFDRPRQLTITPEYIEFDDQDRTSEPPTRFLKKEIEGVRYGIKPIHGYRFTIGRIYCIDIRDVSGRLIKIRLKSIYRVRLKLLHHKYANIINTLFLQHFHDISRYYLRQFHEGQTVELLGVTLNNQGVLFDKKIGWITWDFLGSRRYWHYFTLYSEAAPDHYRAFVFLEEWNAGVLRGLVEAILKEKFPNR